VPGHLADLLGVVGVAFASALVPLINIEAYLGASSLSWAWVRRRMETPKARARLEKWRTRTHERPLFAGALVFLSAFSGFPPFAILAVLAGQLRMNLALFFVLGLAGRWLRFTAVLGSAEWLVRFAR
jgi:membrane protein YqaA with SNARE-associated domain